MAKRKEIVEFGDFQTAPPLARQICTLLKRRRLEPASVLEPTCGRGAFLEASAAAFPRATLLGLDVNASYIQEARERVPSAKLISADFFTMDWGELLARCDDPLLVIGNPPWVTNSGLGALGSDNLPVKLNFQGHRGLDAITGKSNFDISEWMLNHLIELLKGRNATIAMLCKTAVARKVLAQSWKNQASIAKAEIYAIDAMQHFNAAVDACLLICELLQKPGPHDCAAYQSLADKAPVTTFGLRDGKLIADISAYTSSSHLSGQSPYRWRSGIKHDCSKVMELTRESNHFRNGLGEYVQLESTYLYPMLKSSELASGQVSRPKRWMLVPQRSVGQDTTEIETRAPLTWQYLRSHDALLSNRGSSIYHKRPPYSVFGVGDYTFQPWRVAISGFYKKLEFTPVGSSSGKPIVLDDTCYLLPCGTKAEAIDIASLLNSEDARRFYSAYIFWDAKRPITIEILSLLSLTKLATKLHP